VEALKNICGASFVEKYDEYEEFNIRKFQLKQVPSSDDRELLTPDEEVDCTLGKRKVSPAAVGESS
jgi:hypothetical protein